MIVAGNVTKYYGAHAAVRDLHMTIEDGEVVGLLGLNGAGKTTTLRILSGLLVPTSGHVAIGGISMASHPEAARAQLSFLPETPPLYSEMTVTDFLRFVAEIKGLTRQERADAVQEALEATDLLDVQQEVIGTLSHGYHRRIGIASAIVNRPKLVLLDEPTSGLDPVQIIAMRQLIRRLRGKHTILISSHLLGEIHQLCDRLFVLKEGKIAAEGTEEQLAQSVTQTTRLSLEIRGDKAGIVQSLSQLPGYVHHDVTASEQDWHTVQCTFQQDIREQLANTLIQGKFGLRRLERERLELEGIFLQLTDNNKKTRGNKRDP